ncbi:carbohydrate-binding module family 1 protein [Hyaloscypha variabilis F]|uniref:Carbohydrate-binding module family 1 protein n=1 Tax=Hyaloscypha variabilis (strain UAMH 11265 / GT02V1 / F) TaxID=1149755 RepID=A0A2J6RHJ7_HYAVF|nr:carbohydrate-binding module family 1 protein [Hyaloscypha variabilis F]
MRTFNALPLLLAAVPTKAAFSWTNVHTGGGGGFIPSIVFHPKTQGVAYARADIGGMYKLNSDDSWTPISDGIAQDASWHNWGTDALALDPENADVVYAALGMYTNSWDPNNGCIAKSTDQGSTWTFSNLTFKVGGNMPGRGTGERLAVDPANSDIIYFGARSGHGLWKSTDGGVTFSNVTSFTNTGTYREDPSDTTGYESDLMGLLFVTFDSTSATLNGATSRIFVGVADNITASVYESTDAGSTWAPLAGQPGAFFPHKCRLQPTEKALYLTYSNGIGPYDGTDGAVWRYDLTTSVWTDITPVSGSNLYFGFGGLGVDILNPGTLVVAALNSWWPNAQIFRSNNSGATWSPLWEWTSYPSMNNYYGLSTPNAPWIQTSFWDVTNDEDLGWMIESLEIDPFDSNHWLYGTGLTIMGGHDLTNWDTVHNVSIATLANGVEEMAVTGLTSVPGGSELLVAVGDDSGFTYVSSSNLGTAPATNWMTPEFSTSTSVDYAGLTVADIVRSGNTAGTQQIGVSSNGGSTWSIDYGATTTAYGGTVAYSASGDTVLWSTASQGVLRSQYTSTFASISSLPATALIASDKQNDNYFYAGSSATFYVSSNNGETFAAGGSLGSATQINYITVHPTTAGKVYVSTNAGIYLSTNFGSSFTLLTSALTNVYQIALGVGSGSTWNLYAFGTGPAGNKLYGSADNGSTWTDLQGTQSFGAISGCQLAGSGNVAGQVYVGTNGRGVFYAKGTITGGSTTATSTSSTSTSSVKSTSTSTILSTKSTSGTSTTQTTLSTSTVTTHSSITSSTTSSSSSVATCTVGHYAQCGGETYTGCTSCASGYTCQVQNPYYSQCL